MKYYQDAVSRETALIVDGWPWGPRLRTKKRFWAESDKSGNKQRSVTQTLDPRDGRWCNPKKSTYTQGLVIPVETVDDNGKPMTDFLKFDKRSFTTVEAIDFFTSQHRGMLNDQNMSFVDDWRAVVVAYNSQRKASQ